MFTKNEIESQILNVLLIDDSSIEAKFVEIELQDSQTNDLKFELDYAERLSAGLERIKSKSYDVVLLDLGLPDSDGFEGLDKIIAQDPNVAIIMFTGNEDEKNGKRAISKGAQDYVIKRDKYQNRELSNKIYFAFKRKEDLNRVQIISNKLLEAQKLAKLGFFELDLLTNHMVWSDQIFDILEYDKSIKRNYENFFKNLREDDIAILQNSLAACERAYKAPRNNGKQISFVLDYKLKINAVIKHIKLTGKYKNDNSKGVKSVTGNIQDITEFRNTELYLDETIRSNDNLIKKIRVAYYEAVIDGSIIEVNNAFLSLFKYNRKEFNEIDSSELFLNITERQKFIKALESNKEYDNLKILFKKKGGETLTGLLHINSKKGINNVTTIFYGIIKDFSELSLIKAKEVAENTAKIREQFLAQMSHEIRTPMNGVVGMTELLADTPLNPEQLELIQSLKISSKNLLNIINQILDFSKIETGNLTLEHMPFRLIELINETGRIFKFQADKKNIKFLTTLDSSVPEIVVGDMVRLNQILINLIGNALKYTEEGTIRLTLLEDETTAKSVKIKFIIEDSGIGISETNMEKIFRAFTQATEETSRLFGGTGLGLSIARKLVKLMGGEIDVESTIGKGSSFIFTAIFEKYNDKTTQETLSIAEHNPLLKGSDSLNNEDVKATFNKDTIINILYVEDDKMNQIVADKLLKSIYPNINIDFADNGKIGIEKVEKNDYHLVLMDVGLPVMNGLDATKNIRQMKSHKRNIPIVACTAHAFSKEVENCKNAGMNDFLTKPLIKNDIKNKLNKVFNAIFDNNNEQEINKSADLEQEIESSQKNTTAENSILDLSYLQNLSDNDETLMQIYIDTLITNVPIEMEKLENAIKTENWKETGSIAHKLKSSVTYMGIKKAVEDIKFIENNALKSSNLDILHVKYNNTKAAIAKGLIELKKFKKT